MSRLAEVRTPYAIVDADEKGVGFPFLRGREGAFTRRFGLDVLIDDIIALIYISPGEYPNDPELGVGVSRYLFELLSPNLALDIESKIERQVIKYITNVRLINVSAHIEFDTRALNIEVTFQKLKGSRDIIKLTNIVDDRGKSSISVGVAA